MMDNNQMKQEIMDRIANGLKAEEREMFEKWLGEEKISPCGDPMRHAVALTGLEMIGRDLAMMGVSPVIFAAALVDFLISTLVVMKVDPEKVVGKIQNQSPQVQKMFDEKFTDAQKVAEEMVEKRVNEGEQFLGGFNKGGEKKIVAMREGWDKVVN